MRLHPDPSTADPSLSCAATVPRTLRLTVSSPTWAFGHEASGAQLAFLIASPVADLSWDLLRGERSREPEPERLCLNPGDRGQLL